MIHRISHNIHIRIQSTPPERTPTVRAVKAHQRRVVSAIPVAQQIPADARLAQFTVETQARRNFPLRRLLPIDGISDGIGLTPGDFGEDGVFIVGSQQDGARLL
jgi:hypothetical protein